MKHVSLAFVAVTMLAYAAAEEPKKAKEGLTVVVVPADSIKQEKEDIYLILNLDGRFVDTDGHILKKGDLARWVSKDSRRIHITALEEGTTLARLSLALDSLKEAWGSKGAGTAYLHLKSPKRP